VPIRNAEKRPESRIPNQGMLPGLHFVTLPGNIRFPGDTRAHPAASAPHSRIQSAFRGAIG
jgi:hypothetical protein